MQIIQKRKVFILGSIWLLLILLINFATQNVAAQGSTPWTPQQNIPLYHHETNPPVLIADQNRTVHAFSSQFFNEESEKPVRAIMYNRWSLTGGWSDPNDILLSPVKEARLLDVILDDVGMMHLVFFGGDGDKADIYYSSAPAIDAGQAPAWSEPILIGRGAEDPEDGTIAGDDQGNLVVVYSGNWKGHGWYAIYSSDGGDTWSKPDLLFPTYSNTLWPFHLKFHIDDLGLLHAVWSVQNQSDHGQAIYYMSFDFNNSTWTEPVTLAETQGLMGTQAPTIVNYDGSLFVMYHEATSRKQLFIRSDDGGQTWSDPIAPFPHIGFNGPGAFAVDSNGDLHFVWGQRIGDESQTMNGMWHSVWQENNRWSPHETIVSGLKVIDYEGDKSFDPNTARPVISQGNVLLVTWRTDPGSKGNGVWYSYATLETPELTVSPLPTMPSALVASTSNDNLVETPEPTVEQVPEFSAQLNVQDVAAGNPAEVFLFGLVPVTFLILLIGIYHRISHSRQR